MDKVYPFSLQRKEQGIDHIRSLVRAWKHTVSPLCFELQALRREKLHGLVRWELLHGAVKEFGVAGHILQNCFCGTVVGQIAPTLACNV